jgi:hypothetical protein
MTISMHRTSALRVANILRHNGVTIGKRNYIGTL